MSSNSLTPEEVAVILNITKNTVYEMVKRGELSAYRIGRKIRIDEKAINQYKESKQSGNTASANTIKKIEKSAKTDSELFIICGQDIILDILARYLEAENPGVKILRSYKGSYNGLFDLYNDTVNVATAHLWDGDSDTYNKSYVKNMLPGVPAEIVHLAKRFQGFYVKGGNPKSIQSWNDLSRDDIKFVNREKGSGTRILLDERLRVMNISPTTLDGYENIATSHIQVASAVARGLADFGLGNEKSIHQVSGLEFIPLQQESYDLIIKKSDLDMPIIESMLKIIASNEYRNEVQGLGGYEL